MARLWRVCDPRAEAAGQRLALDPAESHHVARVLRLAAGDRLGVFDGHGREWTARIERVEAARVVVALEDERHDPVEAPLEVALYQGLCRAERIDWIVEKATELGVAALHLVPLARSEGPRAGGTRLARWQRIAVESAKQSGRRRVPPVTLTESLPAPARGPAAPPAYLLDPGAGRPGLDWLARPPRSGAVWLAVGPAGGFEPDEVAAHLAAGWQAAGLGPRVLRAETAAIAGLAILLAGAGALGPGAVDSPSAPS